MSATDINDWPGHPDADPDCECCLGDGLQADGETPCPCIDARKGYRAAQTITPAPQPEAATPTAQEAVPVDLSHGWLIHKAGRGWYRPNAKGYTGCIAEAGRYSHEDALAYSHPNGLDGPRDNITIKHESEATTTSSDLCTSGQVRVVAQAALASRAAHPPQLSEMIAAVERAFDEIRELNMSGRDENGHRWANSDLIDQTVTEGLVALRALKGDV